MTTQDLARAIGAYTVKRLVDGQLVVISRSSTKVIPCWMLLCHEASDTNEENEAEETADDYVVFPIIPSGLKVPAAKITQSCKEKKIHFNEYSSYREAYAMDLSAEQLLRNMPQFHYSESLAQVGDSIVAATEESYCCVRPLFYNEQRFLYVVRDSYGEMLIMDFDDNSYRPKTKIVDGFGKRGWMSYVDAEQLMMSCPNMSESSVDDLFRGLDPHYVDRLNEGDWSYTDNGRQPDAWKLYRSIRRVDIVPTIVVLDGEVQRIGYDFAEVPGDIGGITPYIDLGCFRSAYKANKDGSGNLKIRHALQQVH